MRDYLTPLVEEEPGVEWKEPGRPGERRPREGEEAGLRPAEREIVEKREETTPFVEKSGEFGEGFGENEDNFVWLDGPGRGRSGAANLAGRLRRTGRVSRIARGEAPGLTVTAPEAAGGPGGMDLLELDRAVQRDARRYDGGFSLY